jgi:hypothetical protein
VPRGKEKNNDEAYFTLTPLGKLAAENLRLQSEVEYLNSRIANLETLVNALRFQRDSRLPHPHVEK